MLHINNKTENTHKKAFAAEVFVGIMMFSIFHVAITQASDITSDNVIKLVNKARTNVNVAVLAKNDLLQKAAQEKAQDMIDNNYFAHVSPQGKTPWVWIENVGYDYHVAGENLAISYANAEDQQKAWMDSPLHRKNILNPEYKEIGVAVKRGVIDGNETTVAVQMFGTRNVKQPVAIATEVAAEPKPQAVVAGADTAISAQKNSVAKISNNFNYSEFYQKNKPTLMSWLAVMGFAITVVIIDVAALVHKKHEQLFILRDVRNRHA